MDSFASLLLSQTSPLRQRVAWRAHTLVDFSSEGRSRASSVGAALGVSVVSLGWREFTHRDGAFLQNRLQGIRGVCMCQVPRQALTLQSFVCDCNLKREIPLGQRNRVELIETYAVDCGEFSHVESSGVKW